MMVSIHLTNEEKSSTEHYAKLYVLSLEQALKQALFELIQDEYDHPLATDPYADYLKSGKIPSFSALKEELER